MDYCDTCCKWQEVCFVIPKEEQLLFLTFYVLEVEVEAEYLRIAFQSFSECDLTVNSFICVKGCFSDSSALKE